MQTIKRGGGGGGGGSAYFLVRAMSLFVDLKKKQEQEAICMGELIAVSLSWSQ